jgi:hypothetical protein
MKVRQPLSIPVDWFRSHAELPGTRAMKRRIWDDVPYLRVTCAQVSRDRRRAIAERLTEEIVDLFLSPNGRITREQLREPRQYTSQAMGDAPLLLHGHTPIGKFHGQIDRISVGGRSASDDEFVFIVHQTPILAKLYEIPPDRLEGINLRFHPYPPTDFAVGGRLLSDLVPLIGRWMKALSVAYGN